MKKVTRPFIIEYRSKRGRSRTVRGDAFRSADRSADRILAGKEMREELAAWRALFKQEARPL